MTGPIYIATSQQPCAVVFALFNKAVVTEWYRPNEDELKLWRAGAVEAWLNAKGTYDAATAQQVLEEQGMTDFIALLKKAGAL